MPFEEIFAFLFLISLIAPFSIFFIGRWAVVCFLLAIIGEWSRLATFYQSLAGFRGKNWAYDNTQI